ncbi:damage-control phosphatase ARMT1-like [Actinia tenebrosa]|uniref:Sugar phosphate phosphatase n=1 Tax=Actinia tenebrosa TaxID=6105 RepID=A0A6P8HC93_ACTTE|nr:damage-control phosphatase ARMT1-like [Actinia tenebrosa]
MSSERPEPLSGKDEGSYAYLTIRDRMPTILTKVIDCIHRKATEYTRENKQEHAQDARDIVGRLSKLNYEMKTNKKLSMVEDTKNDAHLWNEFLKNATSLVDGSKISWFSGAWLTCECFMYRKIYEALALSKLHQDFDPFREQKQASFMSQQDNIASLANILVASLDAFSESSISKTQELHFEMFLQFSLWGNKCDLSISGGEVVAENAGLSLKLEDLRKHILVNNTSRIWQTLQDQSNQRIDFILDNAGFELFTDLCLAETLLNLNKAQVIFLHLKDFPWFVSDTTQEDFFWTLKKLKESDVESLSKLGHRWEERIQNGSFVLKKHFYWTLCHDFSQMKSTASELYDELAKSKLLLFKGDLSYRKLVGDRKWPHTMPFAEALWGFYPAPLCALRTIKAEVVVGLEEGKDDAVEAVDKDWMITGTYAVIEFHQ